MLGWFKRLFERWEPGKDYDRYLARRSLVSGEPTTDVVDGLARLREAVKQLPPRSKGSLESN